MNMMMPISHRLFAAAINDGVDVRKSRGTGGQSVLVDVQPISQPARGARVSARAGEVSVMSYAARDRQMIF